jgi:hypothetical protein
LLVAAAALAGCGASRVTGSGASGSKAVSQTSSWSLPGADEQNTRDVGGPISAANVATLGVAWTVPITDFGTYGAYSTT